jgi:CubicO group peptidase (beta-lactamase class C family)
VPSTNGHGAARAVARLYSALAPDGRLDGVHVLAPETIARAITEQVNGPDLVLERPTRYGLGFQLTMPERRLGPGPRAFGHFGAGGSLGFADPDARGHRLRHETGPHGLAARARAAADRPGVRRAVAPGAWATGVPLSRSDVSAETSAVSNPLH